MQREHLQFFAEYIERQLGIVYSPDNFFQLENRLSEILSYFRINSVEDLRRVVETGPPASLRQMLLDTATNNETSFFRDMKIFETVRDFIVPQMQTRRPLRVWSAASSSGQEAYSLCMLFKESFPALPFSILASDISQRMLERVGEGVYSQLEVQRGLPTKYLLQYFSQLADGRWAVNAAIRSHVKTEKINLLSPFPQVGRFDVIFCRNVLIYQRVEKKADIINRLRAQLEPGGFLVLGAGESMIGLSTHFQQHAYRNTIVYQSAGIEMPAAA